MKFIQTIFFLVITQNLVAQENIVLSEGTFKVKGLSEQELYFGLFEGDQLVFSLEENKGKSLKEIEIVEYPDNSKFFEVEIDHIDNKEFLIQNTGIYKLRLKNSALGGRVCRYKLERIPADPSKKFNSTVYWETKKDTTFYTINENYLVSKDTSIVSVIQHKVERVHSETVLNGKTNKSIVKVDLPKNTISWSYYLGVGEDAEAVFKQAEEKASGRIAQLKGASKLSKSLISLDFTGSAVLASLVIDGIVELGIMDEKADNIQYWIIPDYANAQLFMSNNNFYQYDNGNGPIVYKRMEAPLSGTFYIGLYNDNMVEGIDVHIRLSAITVTEKWGQRAVEKYNIETWKEPYLKD
ncbi:hypothetical protein C9994_08385 [Marivirga lumbricoides]|uniref:Uncharacterized protein n=1 Tax=Marivirga lumbricoides TaxID=1046115 RepID=A0A2T4DR04_9BACT|nr:hypothetical protein C9994_08385 [Marivirga lumbricoides]